jgi:PIN domain nuclease of toxin-antitoxin system
VRLLVDTHVWLWLQAEPGRIDEGMLDLLADAGNDVLLSAASAWEIAIKYTVGRLPLPEPPAGYVPSRMGVSGTAGLPVTHEHALGVADLPPHHRDPFDRLLVAQARLEGLEIMTADHAFAAYDVPVRWARPL